MLNTFDVQTQANVLKVEAHALPTRCVKYSPDGQLIYTGSDDRHVCVIDARAGHIINSFSHAGMVLSLDCSPDSRHFVVGASNHTLSYWDLGMQQCLQSFSGQHTEQIWGVHFNESGNKIVSVSQDASIHIYESSNKN